MNKNQVDHLFQFGIFPERDSGRKLIETGISWIIIGKKYAYKLKKPVKYSFLDFSTQGKRKFYCEEELRLNRRLTKGIYLEVLPIFKNKNVFSIGKGDGTVIDYIIRMKKMNTARQMDYLLRRSKVTKVDIKKLAMTVRQFHAFAKKIYKEFSRIEMENNFNDILFVKEYLGKILGKRYALKIDNSVKRCTDFIRNNEFIFIKRARDGFVRDCHGDMHSGNIFLYRNPVIFDCIEFDKKLRHIDVLNEIAFLCMDLEAFNKKTLSSYFIRNYNQGDITGDLKKLFLYYKCLHANVRAKVITLQVREERGSVIRMEQKKEIKNYIDLMNSYARKL